MRKIALIIVGLFMSLVASASTLDEITTDINGSTVNLGLLVFNQDCSGFGCSSTAVLSKKLTGKTFFDYIVFDNKGSLTNQNERFEKLITTKNIKDADNKVKIRVLAADDKASKAMFDKWFTNYKTNNWKKVETNLENQKSGGGGGTSGALVMGNMLGKGFSNSSSAGAGLLAMALDDTTPSGSFIFYVEITYKDGTVVKDFILYKNTTVDSSNFKLYSLLYDLIK